ncbi:hypothetical protein IAD21_04001 [Abditibacteriota bacterium]|nr:hypothetical protein IAD21_04001 [Abditibacteriota bacterium]
MRDLGKNALEWSVFGVSCVLVLSLLGFLGYSSWTYTDSPAHIEFHLGKPSKIGKSWQIEVEVENRGSHAVESVEIEVEWAKGKQTAHFVLSHLPRQGKRTGYAIFEAREAAQLSVSELKTRVAGYEEG